MPGVANQCAGAKLLYFYEIKFVKTNLTTEATKVLKLSYFINSTKINTSN